MLPLPPFEWLAPRSLDEVVHLLAEPSGQAMLLAGGTDVLPNLKNGLAAPKRVIGLRRVAELSTIEEDEGGALVVGAGVTLDRLGADPRIAARYPALAKAARLVASPQIRRMGTLGGNLCLDTRCTFINQSAFWRGALGYCIKKDGVVCHVVPGGRKCVAAMSADTPAPLIAYGASIDLVSARGARTLPVAKLFSGDGVLNHVRGPDEVLARVRIPPPSRGLVSGYEKLRARQAIDFPLLSVAAAVVLDAAGAIEDACVVVGALGALPRAIRKLEAVKGRPLDAEAIAAVAAAAEAQCHPLSNLGAEAWRQRAVRPLVERVLAGAAPSAPA